MALTTLNLAEPLVTAMVSLLKANLNTTIDQLNATITDGYTVDHVVQVLPFVPTPSTLAGGMPIVGVHELGADFQDDLQFRLDAEHALGVIAMIQNADHQSLVWQLRRTIQATAYTIEQDRLAQPGVMRSTPANAWSVQFIRTEPGPLLGEPNPASDELPPVSYMSYTALILSIKRGEV